MKRMTPEKLAERAQQLADALNELATKKEQQAKVAKEWRARIKRIEEKVMMLGEAVRLKEDPVTQEELPL